MERNTSSFASASWDSKMAALVASRMKLLFWNVQFGLLMGCQTARYMWIDEELLIIRIYERYAYTRGFGQVRFIFHDIWLRNNFVVQPAFVHKDLCAYTAEPQSPPIICHAATASRREATRSCLTRWRPRLGENGKRWISKFSLNNFTQILLHIKDYDIWNSFSDTRLLPQK